MNLTKMIVINYKHNRLYTFGCTKEKINIDEAKDIDKSGISPSIALALGKAIGVLISEIQDKSPFNTMKSLQTSLQTLLPELDIQYAETTQYEFDEFKKELEKRNIEPPHIDPPPSKEQRLLTKKEVKTIKGLASALSYSDISFTDSVCDKQTFTEYINKIMAILDAYTS